MDEYTLLHRQIHPSYFDLRSGTVSVGAFQLKAKDNNMLSVDNGDLVTAEEAFTNYVKRGFRSVGVLSVTGEECTSLNLPYREDRSANNTSHALIDFSNFSPEEQEDLAFELLEFALTRDWTYQSQS